VPTDLLAVTEVAKEFLGQSGYPFARLEKAMLDETSDKWILTFDVSLGNPKLKNVVVDASAGKVLSFE
jgi:uncharacterized membrane protein YkoI